MSFAMTAWKKRNPIRSTSAGTNNFVTSIKSGTCRMGSTRFILRSMLSVCLLGLTTGAFALKANGFAGNTTGGSGGNVVKASTGTEIHKALCDRASASTPIIIEVEGTINHGNTTKQSSKTKSCNTAEDRIELKGVSNITIVGVGKGATFDQVGIHIREAKNIILQNLTIKNVKKSNGKTSNGGDAIGMEKDVSNVWVDHCTLEASGGESEGFDGLFDMKNNTKNVTLSYSILRNSGRGGLVGSGDSDKGNGPVTFHHNIYKNIDSRTPLLRAATAHCYNNHYDGLKKSGINARLGAKAKVENNYFENSHNPLGTFYTTDKGSWEVKGNIWKNVTWKEADKEFPAGPNPKSTGSVGVSYSYKMDDAGCIPDLLSKLAGANKGLKTSDGSCKSTSVKAGAMNLVKNQAGLTNYTSRYDLQGRYITSQRLARPTITKRGLVIHGLELQEIYSK